ncbi:hypothetical protein GYN24_00265 [Lactococcus piscium]|nr:competence type IV pilus minor pilin ComGG [Lactococcus paracarnosus]MCJ1993026.1 hypothetical protein [Lactococcus paracarnosus]SPC37846.1 conserved hypothetical protein [Lactococcus piscium]
MLYALSISVVFGMILSFYLSAIVEKQSDLLAQESFLYAQLMAKLTVERRSGKVAGQLRFDKGVVSYRLQDKVIQVTVTLVSGDRYQFRMLSGSP